MDADAFSRADMCIEDYLGGVTAYDIAANALKGILVRRGIEPGTMISVLSDMELDLCTADIYMWCASTPSVRNDTEDSDGGWKHKDGGWQTSAFDKRQLREMAKEIYAKWGEERVTQSSRMRIVNF